MSSTSEGHLFRGGGVTFHVAFGISIVSYSFGAAVFLAGMYLFLLYRARLIKYFLILQVLFVINIALNGIYEYLMINWRGWDEPRIFWSVVSYLWAPFFFYCAVLYAYHVAALPFSGWTRRAFLAASVLIGLTILIPLLSPQTRRNDSSLMVQAVYYVNIPVVLLTGLITIVLMLLRIGKAKNTILRTLLVNHLVVELVGMPLICVFYVAELSAGRFMEVRLKTAIDVFVLLWNLQMVVLFVVFARRVQKRPSFDRSSARVFERFNEVGELFSDSLRKYEKSGLPHDVAQRNLDRLERLMREKKPYLLPELTLVSLARMLAIPRNQLSQILNEHKAQSFNDFLNSYRVEEAKHLLSQCRETGNVLRVAFDSGFNSKTTFYRVFRKATGVTPTEYVGRMKTGRLDEFPPS